MEDNQTTKIHRKKRNPFLTELETAQQNFSFEQVQALSKENTRSIVDQWKSTRGGAQTQKILQLFDLAKAMGGPRFPNFELRKGQKTDNIKEFEPLLLDYLKDDKNHVDDAASFQDYFGQDIGLKDWTLLTVAASVWVNAPQCMQLLLQHGANPLHKDSSGRFVLMESLATTRHGHFGPWKVLCQLPAITPEHIRSARLADMTEALILKLRRGTTDIEPLATRRHFATLWKEGFTVYKKTYDPKEVHEFFAEMQLISLETLEEHQPHFPRNGDDTCKTVSALELVEQSGPPQKVIFISHRWLSKSHPDNSSADKLRAILQAGHAYCRLFGDLDPSRCYLWVDYCCMNQESHTAPDFVRGIQSLPVFVLLSDAFLRIDHDEYMTRAWCLLEILFGASMPVKTRNFGLYNFCSDRQGGSDLCTLAPQLDQLLSLKPETGGATNPGDMAYIKALTWFAEDLHKWL